jgi:hypothetical protein
MATGTNLRETDNVVWGESIFLGLYLLLLQDG